MAGTDMGVLRRNLPELLARHRGEDFVFPPKLLCLDPGETTGWSLFENGVPTRAGQVKTIEDWFVIMELFDTTQPTHVIYENYRVYANKFDRHAFSEVYTLRLIGAIEFMCSVLYKIPYTNQMAVQAKGFVTDDKLKQWGYYNMGPKHARDSLRHGIYYLLFNKELVSNESERD